MSKRPNVLILMSEQQRDDCLGIERYPVLLTPTLDEIGSRGARFTRAYRTCPVCIPRAAVVPDRAVPEHARRRRIERSPIE